MDNNPATSQQIPQARIARAVEAWANVYPGEVIKAIQDFSGECIRKLRDIDSELPSLPNEPQLASDYRVALEIGRTEAVAKAHLAKHWKIKDKRKLDDRYREAFRAHMDYDRLRRERNTKQREITEEINSRSGVSIGERVLRLVAYHDAFADEDEARASLLELHPLAGRLKLDNTPLASELFAVHGVAGGVKAMQRYIKVKGVSTLVTDWAKVREYFGLDEDGRKITPDKANANKGKSKRGAKPSRDAKLDKRIYDDRKQNGLSYVELARKYFGDETQTREVSLAIDSHRNRLVRMGK